MAESEFTAAAPLDAGHDRTPFDCGVPALNLYLRNYALQNQKKGIVRNYVTTRAESKAVAAYYSLVYAVIDQKRLPAKLVKGLGKKPKKGRRRFLTPFLFPRDHTTRPSSACDRLAASRKRPCHGSTISAAVGRFAGSSSSIGLIKVLTRPPMPPWI